MSKKWEDFFYDPSHLICGAVAVKTETNTEFIGSAIYIMPGLFLTAKHVIEDPINKEGIGKTIHENKMYGLKDGNFTIKKHKVEIISLLKLGNKTAQRWIIDGIAYSHDLDLAVLTAKRTDGPLNDYMSQLPRVRVNIHIRPIKLDVYSFGYFGKTTHTNDSDSHDITFTSRGGKLIAFHLDKASVAGEAVYEIDNKIEHMMSGGPVCNSDGDIIGLNSSSLEDEEHPEMSRTIATPFIRAMNIKFNFNCKETSLYELAKNKEISVLGLEHLSFDEDHIIWEPIEDCEYCLKIKEYAEQSNVTNPE